MVLTFDFAFGKLQREHPHKLSDYIVKERDERRARPGLSNIAGDKKGKTPFYQWRRSTFPIAAVTAIGKVLRPRNSRQTHNYTGEPGLKDSPHGPAACCLESGRGHRSLSERGIIAVNLPPSTNKFINSKLIISTAPRMPSSTATDPTRWGLYLENQHLSELIRK